MQDVNSLPMGQEPEVGQVYMVRCMDLRNVNFPYDNVYPLLEHRDKMVAIPVIGKIHADPELFGSGGEQPHIHIDVRFITHWELTVLWQASEHTTFHGAIPSFPILPNNSGIELPTPHLHPKMCNYRIGDYRAVRIGYGDAYEKFENEMEKHQITLDKPICPHHGTPLSSCPIRDGVITCPTHTLNWDATTGRLRRKTLRRTDTCEI